MSILRRRRQELIRCHVDDHQARLEHDARSRRTRLSTGQVVETITLPGEGHAAAACRCRRLGRRPDRVTSRFPGAPVTACASARRCPEFVDRFRTAFHRRRRHEVCLSSPGSCGLCGRNIAHSRPTPDTGNRGFDARSPRGLHRVPRIMAHRSDRRRGKPITRLAVRGRASDWLPARGFP